LDDSNAGRTPACVLALRGGKGGVPGGRGGVVKVTDSMSNWGHSHDHTNTMCVLACTITLRKIMVPPSC
jgi:hypothetical protein